MQTEHPRKRSQFYPLIYLHNVWPLGGDIRYLTMSLQTHKISLEEIWEPTWRNFRTLGMKYPFWGVFRLQHSYSNHDWINLPTCLPLDIQLPLRTCTLYNAYLLQLWTFTLYNAYLLQLWTCTLLLVQGHLPQRWVQWLSSSGNSNYRSLPCTPSCTLWWRSGHPRWVESRQGSPMWTSTSWHLALMVVREHLTMDDDVISLVQVIWTLDCGHITYF